MKGMLLTLFLLIVYHAAVAQITTISELLDQSETYYKSLKRFSIQVEIRYKSAIEVGTKGWKLHCYVDRETGVELFNSESSSGYLVGKGDEYSIDYAKGNFVAIKKKKYSIYAQRYSRMPFVNFTSLKNEIVNSRLSFVNTDTTYTLKGSNVVYEFSKSDASVRRIYKSGTHSETNGFYFDEALFTAVKMDGGEIDKALTQAEAIVVQKQNESVPARSVAPKQIDLKLLEMPGITWQNVKPANLQGKKILFDFFFQGCYPCVKSYPYLNDLYNKKDSNLLVIAIDSPVDDSLHAAAYLERYQIKYPVVVGVVAAIITQQFAISTWPTMILVDEKGRVLFRHEGFSPSTFKKISRSL